jgi:hypothetical protein
MASGTPAAARLLPDRRRGSAPRTRHLAGSRERGQELPVAAVQHDRIALAGFYVIGSRLASGLT